MKYYKSFITILLGQMLIIYIDHKNFTCNFLNTDRFLRWILIRYEYGPGIKYVHVSKNIVAYILSIFAINGDQETTHESAYKR